MNGRHAKHRPKHSQKYFLRFKWVKTVAQSHLEYFVASKSTSYRRIDVHILIRSSSSYVLLAIQQILTQWKASLLSRMYRSEE